MAVFLRRTLVLIISLVLFNPFASYSASPIKVGATCQTEGAKKKVNGKNLICIKQNNRKIWQSADVFINSQLMTASVSSLKVFESDFGFRFCFNIIKKPVIVENYEVGLATLRATDLPQDFITSYSSPISVYRFKERPRLDVLCETVRIENFTDHNQKMGQVPNQSLLAVVRGVYGNNYTQWSNSVFIGKKQLEALSNANSLQPTPSISPSSSPSVSPTSTPSPSPSNQNNNFGRAPFFGITFSGQRVSLTITDKEYSLYKYNGFSDKTFVTKAVDSTGKEFVSREISRCQFPICADIVFNWDITYGDIWQFSVAPVNERGRGLWSKPRTLSMKNRREIIAGDQNPIGGKYLLGDIGPGGGRIFLTPDSADTHLKGYSAVSPKTPRGFYYEIAPTSTFFGFGKPCWPGMAQRLEPIVRTLSDSDGQKNTSLIIDSGLCSQDSISHQAKALVILGFQDWFIPSENEIAPLYTISTPEPLWVVLNSTGEVTDECILSTLDPFGRFYKVNGRGYKAFAGSNISEISGMKCAVRKFKL
jgi:hypothetical protein